MSKFGNIGDFTQVDSYPTSPQDAFGLNSWKTSRAHHRGRQAAQRRRPSVVPPPTARGEQGRRCTPSGHGEGAGLPPRPDIVQLHRARHDPVRSGYRRPRADPLDKSELRVRVRGTTSISSLPDLRRGDPLRRRAQRQWRQVPGLTFNPMMLLHGEQFMELRKPLPTAGHTYLHPQAAAHLRQGMRRAGDL